MFLRRLNPYELSGYEHFTLPYTEEDFEARIRKFTNGACNSEVTISELVQFFNVDAIVQQELEKRKEVIPDKDGFSRIIILDIKDEIDNGEWSLIAGLWYSGWRYDEKISRIYRNSNFLPIEHDLFNLALGFTLGRLLATLEKHKNKLNENLENNIESEESDIVIPDSTAKKIAWLYELGVLDKIMELCKPASTDKHNLRQASRIISSFTDLKPDTVRKTLDAIYYPTSKNQKNNPLKSDSNKVYIHDLKANLKINK